MKLRHAINLEQIWKSKGCHYLRSLDPKFHAAPTLRLVSESSCFPAISSSNTCLLHPCRRTLHVSYRIRNAQWPARSSVSRMVVEGSCSGPTTGKSSWSDLADADGAYMQTPYVINGRHLTRLTRQGRSSEGVVLTGTVTIVSAMNSFLPQCRTKLPGKCPPVLMAVTPGSTFSPAAAGPSISRSVCGVGGF